MTGEPVSWLVVERGWAVVASDGAELGTVEEVLGDTGGDIFNGLAVSPGLLRSARYVPAERVHAITEGRIELDLTQAEFDRLGEHAAGGPVGA
jgi:uncharacterized protein YrrD